MSQLEGFNFHESELGNTGEEGLVDADWELVADCGFSQRLIEDGFENAMNFVTSRLDNINLEPLVNTAREALVNVLLYIDDHAPAIREYMFNLFNDLRAVRSLEDLQGVGEDLYDDTLPEGLREALSSFKNAVIDVYEAYLESRAGSSN